MKKRILFFISLIIALSIFLTFAACDSADDTSQNETASVAGKYAVNSGYWLDSDIYVIEQTIEFFADGSAKMATTLLSVSTGETISRKLDGFYVWEKGDYIDCIWEGSSNAVSYLYTGITIDTGYATLNCIGENSLGEFEGMYNRISYGINGPGNIEGDAIQYVLDGGNTTSVTAVPSIGAKFVKWSDGLTSPTRSDMSISDNIKVYAEFTQVNDICYMSYAAAQGGTISGETHQVVLKGFKGTAVTAVPNEGYAFIKWSDGVMTATRTDIPTNNLSVTAEFAGKVTLSYTADEGGTIQGNASQEVFQGSSGSEIYAVPNSGYVFTMWSDGRTDNPRIDIIDPDNPQAISVIARFEKGYVLEYSAGDGGTIQGTALQEITAGSSGSEVTAVPNKGYVFAGWSDGRTDNPRYDKIAHDNPQTLSVIAEFVSDPDYSPFNGGNGTLENPYQICNALQLYAISSYPSANFVLTDDILLPEVGSGNANLTPLCSEEYPFRGTLDGAGHKIINLSIFNTQTFYAGLFSVIDSSGNVKNLTFENASVIGTNYVGIIAGHSWGSISDCSVTGTVIYNNTNGGEVYVGGIAGYTSGNVNGCIANTTLTAAGAASDIYAGGISGCIAGTINSCSANVLLKITKTRSNTYAGGITGEFSFLNSSGEFLTLSSSGTISISSVGNTYVGGIAGYSPKGLSLNKCFSETTIFVSSTGNYSYTGGILGYCGSCNISNSHVTGNITSEGDRSHTGGLLGSNFINSECTFTDCNVSGNVANTGNESYAGGLIGHNYVNSNCTFTGCFASGNITGFGSYSYVGGLIGLNSNCCNLTSCFAEGNVTNTADSHTYTGGLIGTCYGVNASCTLIDCHAEGNVTSTDGTSVYTGGLIGGNHNDNVCTLTNCYSTGDISSNGSESSISGGLIGGYGYGDITNCYAIGDVASNGSDSSVGGLVGSGSGNIANSYATGNVISAGSNARAGGLIGGGKFNATNCYATGNVTCLDGSTSYAGGLIGYALYNSYNCYSFTYCYATGDVMSKGGYSHAGGLIGCSSGYLSLIDCYSTGDVTATSTISISAGGLIGYSDNSLSVFNCYSSSKIHTESEKSSIYVGGLVGYTSREITLNNAHWLNSTETDATYAIGFSFEIEGPYSTGSTPHSTLEDFYSLADTLNAGREVPVWEHKEENSLHTLICKTDETTTR